MSAKQIEMATETRKEELVSSPSLHMPSPAKHTRSRSSVILDAIRGSAAIIVLLNHVRAAFFVDYDQVAHKNLLVKLFYFVAGFGHEAVIVFFILSGYLISSSVFRSINSNRWSWSHYALNRLTRLYVVLVPALLLSAFWDHLGLSLFPHAGIYTASPIFRFLCTDAVVHKATWVSWIGNLMFVQTILVPPYGSNGALWSLSYEFWYYVLFPLLLLGIFVVKTPGRSRVAYVVLGVSLLIFVGKPIALYFLIWLMGTAVSLMRPSGHASSRSYLVGSIFAFAVSLIISRFHFIHSIAGCDFVIGIAFAALMYGIVNLAAPEKQPGSAYIVKAAVFLSAISYSLYLVHLPLLTFCSGWLIGAHMTWQPDGRHLLVGTLLVLGAFGYACLIWWLAEARTDRVRKWFGDRMIKSM